MGEEIKMNDEELNNYDNIIYNICRVLFYTPIIFFGTVIVSITYDYITFKDEEINKKSD